ncbi:MAG: hypothetical protein WCM93_10725 [Bacteroidota bacterium]
MLQIILYFLISSGSSNSPVILETPGFKYGISSSGKNLYFIDKTTGKDYFKPDNDSNAYCAFVEKEGKKYNVSSVQLENNLLTLNFKDAEVTAKVKVEIFEDRATMEVCEVKGNPDLFTFVNVPLTIEGKPYEPFGASLLAMNLQTRVWQLPALQNHLVATCYKKFGMEGAKVTLLGFPTDQILPAIRKVMQNSAELPFSDKGGAWALDNKEGYGSYLMNFGTLTKETVNEWIQMCDSLGFNQIDNHGGQKEFFDFGSFDLNPEKWPNGWTDFKEINSKLHKAGISSLLHTYGYYITKNSRYVTPIPSADLCHKEVFTLKADLGITDTIITVKESTLEISSITSFFVVNSRTLKIGSELIEFRDVSKSSPYKFLGCKRGACGTVAASHKSGENAFHLKERFGMFLPKFNSKLFEEIAKRTAEIIDYAGFNGLYLDALDWVSPFDDDPDVAWYYDGKFILAVARYLKKPVGMEYSFMSHLWWHYRSRWQAWDRPNRGYKKFVDIHAACIKSDLETQGHGVWKGNSPLIEKYSKIESGGIMLPLQLGWWGHQTWDPPQKEPTFLDDVEYLCCKMIANNAGMAMLGGFDQKTLKEIPAYVKFNRLIRQYETLRHKGYFGVSIKAQLREAGKEFTLFKQKDESWNFKPRFYKKHKLNLSDSLTFTWKIENSFSDQPIKLRIEPLMAVKAFNDQGNILLASMSSDKEFSNCSSVKGVTGYIERAAYTFQGQNYIKFGAQNDGSASLDASWIKMEKKFGPYMNLEKNQGLGVWIKGDGKGEILNLRLESPEHLGYGTRGDHFIKIDFTGWKYFELVEIESYKFSDFIWPSNSIYYVYDSYITSVAFNAIDKLQLWYNNIPPGESVECCIGPVKAVPLVSTATINPAIQIGENKVTFPVGMKPGMYLECMSPDDCKLFDSKGNLLQNVKISGNWPDLMKGINEITFTCDGIQNKSQRIQVTVIGEGNPL